MKLPAFLFCSLLGTLWAAAELVEEEILSLDPSGMVSRKTILVEKQARAVAAPASRDKAGPGVVGAEEAVPFLSEEKISRFARHPDCWVDNGRICLVREPVQGADGCVVLEAEEARTVQPEDGRVAVGFDEADGCRYVAFLNRAEYAFEVNGAGAYQSWHRCWFPVRGNWVQSETLNREPSRVVADNPGGGRPDNEWLWAKGPVYELAAGPQRLVLDYHGGARLDKIVLAPVTYTPQGKGPVAAYKKPAVTGRVETVLLDPPAIEKWYRLSLNPLGGGGQVEAQYSLDAGKSWQTVPADGSLQGLGSGPEGKRALTLAFQLTSADTGVTPMLIAPVVTFAGEQPLALANSRMRILFSRSKGSVVAIRNLQNNEDCVAAGSSAGPLIELTLLAGKALKVCPEPVLVAQRAARTWRGHQVLTQEYQWLDGKIEATVTATLGSSEQAAFTLALRNRGESPIVHVDFPRLSGLRIGGNGTDDGFLIPAFAGNNLFRNPGNSQPLWKYATQYPWHHSMKWVDLWDASGGLYVGSHDATFRDTAMLVGGTPRDSIRFLFRKLVHVVPGKDWTSQPYIVATHAGDWHWAARQYGTWARTCSKPPNPPRWLKEEFDGFHARVADGFPNYGFTNVPRTVVPSAASGWPPDVAGNRQGFDAMAGYCTLFPYPNPAWGGAEEFAQTCELIRQLGGHSIWYINWLLTNPLYAAQSRMGAMAKALLPADSWQLDPAWMERAISRAPSGDVVGHPPPADAVYHETKLCDETAAFAEYKRFWAEKYVKDFHADGIYWDCLLFSYGGPCYDAAHHARRDLGQWANGSAQTLRKIVEVTRAANPHAFHMGENMTIMGVEQFQDLSSGALNDEVFRYTFPDWLIGGNHWGWGTSAATNFDRLNYDFLIGARVMNPHMVNGDGKMPSGVAPDYSLQLLRLRQRVKQLLYPATFRNVDGVALDLPPEYQQPAEIEAGGKDSVAVCGILMPGTGIRARRYTLARPGTRVEAFNLINTEKKPGAFLNLRESTLKSVKKAWAFDLADKLAELPVERGQALRLPVPVAPASTLVLVENCEPLITITAPSYGTWNEKIPVKVSVLNLNDRDISGQLRIRKQKGFASREVAYGPIAPGEEKAYALELTAKENVPVGRHDLEVIAEGDGVKANRLCWIYIGNPLRLAVYPTAERLGVDVQVESFSGAPIDGSCSLAQDTILKTPQAAYTFTVPPGGKATVTVPMELQAPLDIVHLARLEVRYGNYTVPLVKSLVPPVPNPGFEVELAGDGHPDFWMGRCQPGDPVIGYSQWGLDRQDKHTGNASAWLNPPGLNQTSTALVGVGGMVHAGKKYRVKVAIKREQASEKIYAQFIAYPGGCLYLGSKGTAGKWEEFEGVLSTATNKPPANGVSEVGCFTVRLENGSTGKVRFDSIRVEELP